VEVCIHPVLRIRGSTYCPKSQTALLSGKCRLERWHKFAVALRGPLERAAYRAVYPDLTARLSRKTPFGSEQKGVTKWI
jgi:hypothetical protein